MKKQILRAILVDDEMLARVALRQALVAHPNVQVIGECGSAVEAQQAVEVLDPDLLFLDISMPGMDGFALLRELGPGQRPMIVFATALRQHALDAFEANAVDYLLKPIDQTRFDRAMIRVHNHWAGLNSAPAPSSGKWAERISVTVGEGVRVIRASDINWARSEGNYVQIHAKGIEVLHRMTLRQLTNILDPSQFMRIHRNALVNIECVQELHPLFQGSAEVVLKDGTRLQLSRRFGAHARRMLGTS